MLDWERLLESDAVVTAEAVTDEMLGRLSTPWYVDREAGREVSYRDGTGRPLLMSEVPDWLDALEPERVEKMERIAASWRAGSPPWLMLCYAVGDVLLVLDGNHRLSATVVHGLHLGAMAVVLRGPLDPVFLPDLVAFI